MAEDDWASGLLGPVELQADGVTAPARPAINLVGFDAFVNEPYDRIDFVARRSTVTGDTDGIAHITAAEVVAEGDATVEPRSKLGHVKTLNDTPVPTILFAIATHEWRRIDIIVTATNADGSKGATWTIRAQVNRVAGAAALVSGGTDVSPDAGNTALLDCTVDVNANNVRVVTTGLAAEAFTFGWEVRSQKQVMAT